MLRKTIMLDEKLEKKIREIQGNLIKKTRKNVSFSQVLNQALDECFFNKRR